LQIIPREIALAPNPGEPVPTRQGWNSTLLRKAII
jgi:hypothetical protein